VADQDVRRGPVGLPQGIAQLPGDPATVSRCRSGVGEPRARAVVCDGPGECAHLSREGSRPS
jgi:hypothetical protein